MDRVFADKNYFSEDLSGWDVSSVTSMDHIFSGSVSFSADVSTWDTSRVETMVAAFKATGDFGSHGVSQWNVSSVTSVCTSKIHEGLFAAATNFAVDLSSWDTSRVQDMEGAFGNTNNFTANLANWNLSSVTNMKHIFVYCKSFAGNLSDWITTSATSLQEAFQYTREFDADLSSWDTSSVTNMDLAFYDTLNFKADISTWNTSQVRTMERTFAYSHNFSSNIDQWDVSSVQIMDNTFLRTINFGGDLNQWNPHNVETMVHAFSTVQNFTASISKWNISSVTNLQAAFANNHARDFSADLSNWDTSRVQDLSNAFQGTEDFDSGIGAWDVSSCTKMRQIFRATKNFRVDLSQWDTSRVRIFGSAFAGSESFNGVVSDWDFSSTTTLHDDLNGVGLFEGAKNFLSDVSGWNTSHITDLTRAFRWTANFSAYLGWDTSSVSQMWGIFEYSRNFSADITAWNTSKVTDLGMAFANVVNFNADISSFDVSSVTSMYWIFSRSSGLGLDTSLNWDTSRVEQMDGAFYNASWLKNPFCWDLRSADPKTLTKFSCISQGGLDCSCSSLHPEFWEDNQETNIFAAEARSQSNGETVNLCDFINSVCEEPTPPCIVPHTEGVSISQSKTINQYFCPKAANESPSPVPATAPTSHTFAALTTQRIGAAISSWEATRTPSEEKYGPIEEWDTSKVTKMYQAFGYTTNISADLSAWDTQGVTDMHSIFRYSTRFWASIPWETSQVKDLTLAFADSMGFHADVSAWDVSSVRNLGSAFANSNGFAADIGGWNVSFVTDLSNWRSASPLGIFEGSNNLSTNPVSGWDTSSVQYFTKAFYNASWFNTTVCWDLSSAIPSTLTQFSCFSEGGLDCRCPSLNLPIGMDLCLINSECPDPTPPCVYENSGALGTARNSQTPTERICSTENNHSTFSPDDSLQGEEYVETARAQDKTTVDAEETAEPTETQTGVAAASGSPFGYHLGYVGLICMCSVFVLAR